VSTKVTMSEKRFIPMARDRKGWEKIHATLDARIKKLVPEHGAQLDWLYVKIREDLGSRHSLWLRLNDIAECAKSQGFGVEGVVGNWSTYRIRGNELVTRPAVEASRA
jgi:hypothetical protein